MIQVKKDGIILEKTALLFENEGVLNPAAIREGDFVHMFYRRQSFQYWLLQINRTFRSRTTDECCFDFS
jgi:hypothetical protein